MFESIVYLIRILILIGIVLIGFVLICVGYIADHYSSDEIKEGVKHLFTKKQDDDKNKD